MSGKQAHDIGFQKRQRQQEPLTRDRLRWLRLRRRHPGPLPPVLRHFGDWLEAGKPGRAR